MAKYIDAENDYLYIKGQQNEQEKFVSNLLTESDFSIERIAKMAGVPVELVKHIQQKFSANE